MLTTSEPARDALAPGSGETYPVAAPWRARQQAGASDLAFALVTAAIVFMPFLRPTGPGNSAPDDVLIVACVAATMLALLATRGAVRLAYVGPVGVLVGAGAVAALANEPTTAAILALGQDLVLFLFAIAIVNAVRTVAQLRAVLRIWALSATAWAAVMAAGVILGNDALAGIAARTGSRASFRFGDANLAASYFVVSILVVCAARCPRRPLPRAGAYVILVVAVVMTGSLGGMLSLVVAVCMLATVKIARTAGVMCAIAVVVLVGPLVFVALKGGFEVLTDAARDPSSVLHDSFGRASSSRDSRDLILGEDAKLYARAPLIGNGPTSTKGDLARAQAVYVKEAHNDYVATGIERGALGILGLALLLAAATQRSRRALRRARDPVIAGAVPNVAALVAALLALACSAMFYEVLHFRHVWAMLGIVAAVGMVRARRTA